jgi:hypothetical protein
VSGVGVRGGVLTLTLSESASVIVTVTQKVPGHRRRTRRCRPGGKRGRKCTASVRRAQLTFGGAVGVNKFRIAAKLRPGRYTAAIVAVDAAGRTSSTVTISFTVPR